jgi:hypothetical protein
MKRTFINIAIASFFTLGALALVGCKDRQEHESTMDKQPSTSGATSGASGVSGTASEAAATSGSGS